MPKRVRLDASIHTDPIDVEELKDSVCILGDIDVMADRKIREGVYSILNQVLEIGRHYKITCVVTNHLPTNGKRHPKDPERSPHHHLLPTQRRGED